MRHISPVIISALTDHSAWYHVCNTIQYPSIKILSSYRSHGMVHTFQILCRCIINGSISLRTPLFSISRLIQGMGSSPAFIRYQNIHLFSVMLRLLICRLRDWCGRHFLILWCSFQINTVHPRALRPSWWWLNSSSTSPMILVLLTSLLLPFQFDWSTW